MIIDAHQHFWQFDPVRDAWIDASMGVLRQDFLPTDLAPILAANGVDGCVAVQADQSLAESDFLLELADRHPFIRGVVGWVDLCAPDVEEQLARYAAHPKFVGVRHILQGEPAGFMARPDFRRGISLLHRYGLTYDLLVYHYQLPEAIDLVDAFPEQRFVLDHLAKPVIDGPPDPAWVRNLRTLAGFPGVSCKLSGMVTEVPGYQWTAEALQPYLTVAVEAFGPDRLLYGSDWPVCLLAADYAAQFAVYRNFPGLDSTGCFGSNAERIYGLPPVTH
ncbi:L-fuconolactonase [Lewinella marina]|uniref:Amidohydrolase n=1 Tax=Neolewinella marina TaxID=438751 RepID=A0A2G0CJ96_9BACT|nr:amidohydrolase family protein [Neolewinella marina]NJB84796.1 L-fuconolactonase [Neolewinella marina]PHL00046.1 amidohydrolase [Neolewinella marina]